MHFTPFITVKTGEIDENDNGSHSWECYYTLFDVIDEFGNQSFDLYHGDKWGENATMICTGTNRQKMISLTLKLGTPEK